VALVVALPALGGPASADEAPTRGRIDGDVALVLGAGMVIAPRAPRLECEARIRYLDSAGVFVAYEDSAAFGSEPKRVLSAGVELRPLFLGRWLEGLEVDNARLDLFVDSFGLELGVAFSQPSGSAFGSTRGLQIGLGLELPMLPKATGPWVGLHAGVRWNQDAAAMGLVQNVDDREAYVALTVAWHQLVGAHLVNLGDRFAR